jgi:hypothetical protein
VLVLVLLVAVTRACFLQQPFLVLNQSREISVRLLETETPLVQLVLQEA